MNKNIGWMVFILLAVIVILGSCNLPQGNSQSETQIVGDSMLTSVAMTVEAHRTQKALTGADETAQAPESQITPDESVDPLDGDLPAVMTNTPEPNADTTPVEEDAPCDLIGFVNETVEDGTVFAPGETFVKTWSLKNAGSCVWTPEYDLVFLEGDSMGGPASRQLTTVNIEPGQEITIDLELVAPTEAGTYRGDWMLRNTSGVIFGFANDASFWVDIVVEE